MIRSHLTERNEAMNIGNQGYSSWIHNTSAPEYGNGNRSVQKESEGNLTYREQILAHMEKMAKKVKDGTVEPSFQIGGQSFTIKEWEKLLMDFDDAAEGLQEQIKELIAEVEAQAEKEALRRKIESGTAEPGDVTTVSVPVEATTETVTVSAEGGVTAPPADSVAAPAAADGVPEAEELEKRLPMLTDEVTKCSYPGDDPKRKHWFITCYGQDGISCVESYYNGEKWVNKDCWSLSYTEEGQYEKVMAFLRRFPQDANLRFASHENFWKDFLAGEIDEDDFVHFFETSTRDGVPDYTYEKDGSTYIDREKVKYAKYMNGFGAHFYTAEEMELIQRAVINENRKGLQKISDYGGQMTIPENGGGKAAGEEDDDLKTQIITKPDGSTVLQIETSFGVMEVEISEAQKFGLQYNARPGAESERTRSANPFADQLITARSRARSRAQKTVDNSSGTVL